MKFGEGSVCENFRVTSGGALQKRPGSKTVAVLSSSYSVKESDEETVLLTESGVSSASFTAYPRLVATSPTSLKFDGDSVTLNYDSRETYAGYYLSSGGSKYRFSGVTETPRSTVKTRINKFKSTGGSRNYGVYMQVYDSVVWDGSKWITSGGGTICVKTTTTIRSLVGQYAIADSAGDISAVVSDEWPEDYDFGARRNTNGWIIHIDSLYTGNTEDDPEDWGPWGTDNVVNVKFALNLTVLSEKTFTWKGRLCSGSSNTESTVRALWSGYVGSREVLCAAASGSLWELSRSSSGSWTTTSCGVLDTSGTVSMFGFSNKLYILNGKKYMVWDGDTLREVDGYRPIVTVSTLPAGGGTTLQQVNKLTSGRRCWFSPDGTSTVFQLPETGIASVDWVKDLSTGETVDTSYYLFDTTAGTVTFDSAPSAGVNTLEIAYSATENYRSQVDAMTCAELYNGVQDTRVFIYGDGTNKTLYSGIDYDGVARADYFPDLNEAAIGEENTPVTALIRHYNRLLCFKTDSAWSMYYDTITLEDGTVTAGFYISPVNRDVGCCSLGQARLVENRPRTLDGRSVIEWKATSSSGNITGDQRNASVISQRVESTIRTFDLTTARTFYDKVTREYYVIGSGGEALVHNVDADVWYTYTGFKAYCMINYKDEVYYGTYDGVLKHFSTDYKDDDGAAIVSLWESGAMDFGMDFRRKYSAMLWVGIKPESAGYLKVTAKTDRRSDFIEYEVSPASDGEVPTMERVKLRARKFTYYKLVLESDKAGSGATVVSADLRVRGAAYVR